METKTDPYPTTEDMEEKTLSSESSTHNDESNPNTPSKAVNELTQLAECNDFTVKESSTDQFMTNMGIAPNTENILQERIDAFRDHYRALIAQYSQETKTCSSQIQDALYVLNGWNYQNTPSSTSSSSTSQQLLAETCRKTSGGYFFRWNGTGVAINPGTHFLENLHASGLSIADIDCVIVTQNTPEAYADIPSIYDLNYQLNLNTTDSDLHVIHYYLNQQAHRDLAANLKPNFKQERNTIHSLELYVDSPDVEKVSLSESITLNYFLTTSSNSPQNRNSSTPTCLGMRLDCTESETGGCSATIGYLSGTPWSPILAHHLGKCDILVVGFESTNSKDFRKIKYNDNSLGYFGSYTLMEEVAPRILLCCEFSGCEGDVRLEVIKKMRQEYAYSNSHGTVVLPGDTSMYLDLKTMSVRCSVSNSLVEPSQVHVTKTTSTFGNLQYLSPSCLA